MQVPKHTYLRYEYYPNCSSTVKRTGQHSAMRPDVLCPPSEGHSVAREINLGHPAPQMEPKFRCLYLEQNSTLISLKLITSQSVLLNQGPSQCCFSQHEFWRSGCKELHEHPTMHLTTGLHQQDTLRTFKNKVQKATYLNKLTQKQLRFTQ